jgi:hypothetical protein
MLCLEVIVNGERRAIAGDPLAESVSAEIAAYPQLGETWINVDGQVLPVGQPHADASWISAALSVGDSVLIRVIDSSEATAPTLGRSDPSLDPHPTDDIPFVCSFCRREPVELDGMLGSRRGSICYDCIRSFAEMIKKDSQDI